MAEQQAPVIEILRRLQTDVAEIKHDLQSLRLEVSTINHHLAGFHSTDAVQSDELSRLRQRVQTIERRPTSSKEDTHRTVAISPHFR